MSLKKKKINTTIAFLKPPPNILLSSHWPEFCTWTISTKWLVSSGHIAMLKNIQVLLERKREKLMLVGSKGFPWRLRWERICLQCRKCGFDPWVRRIPRRRKWQPIPVLLLGESLGQRRLAAYSPWSCRVRHNWAIDTHTLHCRQIFYCLRHQGSPLVCMYVYVCVYIYISLLF